MCGRSNLECCDRSVRKRRQMGRGIAVQSAPWCALVSRSLFLSLSLAAHPAAHEYKVSASVCECGFRYGYGYGNGNGNGNGNGKEYLLGMGTHIIFAG